MGIIDDNSSDAQHFAYHAVEFHESYLGVRTHLVIQKRAPTPGVLSPFSF